MYLICSMNNKTRICCTILILTLLASIEITAQNVGEKEYGKWYVETSGYVSTGKALPFWNYTNKGGVIPETSGGLVRGGVHDDYHYGKNFSFGWGIGLAGYAAAKGNEYVHNSDGNSMRGMIQDLYASATWKKLNMDIGIRRRETEFGGLSVTGGNITWSDNAQSFPGYNLKSEWITVPGTKEVMSVRFTFGDYGLWDNRFVKHTLLHNQSLYFKFALNHSRNFTLTAGMEAWAQWGGNSPIYGPQPRSFHDYLRIIVGAGGDDNATISDQINALGNHLGRELIRLDYDKEKWHLTIQHDRPFDDGSGIGFQNFPDAVNTIYFAFKDKDKWFSDFLFEFIYTKCQSGDHHERPATLEELKKHPDKLYYIVGGNDDYFNNGEYQSAWTYNGRTIGIPLFYAAPKDKDGVTRGVVNNRIVAFNVGVSGKIARQVPYTMKLTYSKNFGRYSQSIDLFKSAPRQVSGAFELALPEPVFRGTTGISFGMYADKGSVFPDTVGLSVKLSWMGKMSSK